MEFGYFKKKPFINRYPPLRKRVNKIDKIIEVVEDVYNETNVYFRIDIIISSPCSYSNLEY